MSRRPRAVSSPEAWMDLAVRYLARWDRTTAQVRQYLLQKGASPAQVARTIGRLSALRYLDDRSYAERWLQRRMDRQPMGRARLKAELVARGIADTLAAQVLRDALLAVDEAALAHRALQAKQRRGGRLAPPQVLRLLRQWGFEEETIDRIMEARSEHE